MNNVCLALFEGALLFEAGIPVREMYDHIDQAYGDDNEIKCLFADLKMDWDSSSSPYPFKMIGPFIALEKNDSEYLLWRWFTEVAASTSMVDTFWKSCGFAYVLKKQIVLNPLESIDLKLAREIFGVFQPDHPAMVYLFSLSQNPNWKVEFFQQSDETISFSEWAEAHSLNGSSPQLRCLEILKDAAERAAYPELVDKIKSQWEIFSRALLAISA